MYYLCCLDYRKALETYVKREDWYMWVQMAKGSITMPIFQSLDAYWPGLLVSEYYCAYISFSVAVPHAWKMFEIPLVCCIFVEN